MPLIRRTASEVLGPADLPVQDTLGDPDAIRVRAAMATADWPTVREILMSAPDPDDQSFLVQQAAEVEGSEEWLPDVVRTEVDSTLASLVHSARLICWAWTARSKLRARYVSRERFALFHERLRMAEDCLQEVVEREPDNASAWSGLITVSRGLEFGPEESWRRFEQAVAACPTHLRSHSQMLQNLCQKWSGSHAEMHNFAYTAMVGAPEGSQLGCLIPMAHLEHWHTIRDSEEGTACLRSPAVRASLRAAADRSLRNPAYRAGRTTLMERNWFAAAFYLADEPEAAAEQFRAIRETVTTQPWSYLGSGVEGKTFCQARDWALARA